MTLVSATKADASPIGNDSNSVYVKIAWRLMPFILAAYVVNQLDRMNIGFAKLKFMSDVGLTDAAYGFGAGLFFIGYVIFEVPSNLYLQRAGARKTFLRIMVLWGTVSMATALVQSPSQLYAARFLLGAAEAGFTPGIILYLTYWFPTQYRGRITSTFLMAITFAGIAGGPISGGILHAFSGASDIKDWQWLFLIEGGPAIVLGVAAYFFLDDGPQNARWLSEEEKSAVQRDLLADATDKAPTATGGLAAVLLDPKVYLAGLVYFAIIAGNNAMTLWLPSIISGFGQKDILYVGLLSSLPYIAGAIGMYSLARRSDLHGERRWHSAAGMALTAMSYAFLGSYLNSPVIAMVFLTLAAIGVYGSMAVFWTIPPTYLPASSAAGGIAMVSSIGMFGGFFSPIILGWAKTTSGSLQAGFLAIAALLVAGAAALILGVPKPRREAVRGGQGIQQHPH